MSTFTPQNHPSVGKYVEKVSGTFNIQYFQDKTCLEIIQVPQETPSNAWGMAWEKRDNLKALAPMRAT